MEQREKRYEDDKRGKRNRTIQRNIGMKKQLKSIKYHSKEVGSDHDDDENEARRKKADKDTHGI
jgi:hypothetical protein